jgi:hypothetical protein
MCSGLAEGGLMRVSLALIHNSLRPKGLGDNYRSKVKVVLKWPNLVLLALSMESKIIEEEETDQAIFHLQ